MTTGTAVPFALERLGVIMEGDPHNPDEAWGVLNPACCRGRDGRLDLYPRVAAEGNRSRIGIACVVFENDEPVGVERSSAATKRRGTEKSALAAALNKRILGCAYEDCGADGPILDCGVPR